MRRSLLWVLALVALILQITVAAKAEILGVRPDGVMVVLVYLALAFGAPVGSLVGFGLGLAQFAIMSSSMASLPLAGTVVGFLVGRYGTKIMYESYLAQILIIVGACLVFDTVNLVWSSPADLAGNLLRWSLPGAAYTALAGVAVVVVLERILGLRLIL
ncbi:MAG: rod shape-determining protein MreD [bacterium]